MHSHSDMPLVTDGNAAEQDPAGRDDRSHRRVRLDRAAKGAIGAAPWTDFTGYFATLEKNGISVNLLSYVGLGTVRELVVGDDDTPATPAQITADAGASSPAR